MPHNIEIKARLSPEQVEMIRKEAMKRSTADAEFLEQTDTFFNVSFGRLKVREFGDGHAELIAYERSDQIGPKHSSYVRSPSTDPRSLHEALVRSLGVRGVVQKHRQVIHVGQTRVHLDAVAGLGNFLELEVVLRDGQPAAEGEKIAAELMDAFGISRESLIAGAYIDLIESNAGA